MKIGQRVSHPVYGPGTIIAISDRLASFIQSSNGWSRYNGALNAAIKFDNGGPQGWALNASNNLKEVVDLGSGTPLVLNAQAI